MQKHNISKEFLEEHGFTPEKIADTMISFYAQIDALSARIETALKARQIRLRCHAGCCGCCLDGLTMTRAEAAVIAKLYPDIARETPHATGACAFLDDCGKCRIYEARPLKCRTFGLPMVWEEDGVLRRDICQEMADGIALETLDDGEIFSPVVADMKLGMMEELTYGGLQRVGMRAYFTRDPNDAAGKSL